MLEDAELSDIHFIDPDNGFAVGDRGVIWKTADGGRNWQLVDGPASSRLDSIRFVDESRGWIVGGWTHPYTQSSHATMLVTEDGGRRWTPVAAPTLPALGQVQFDDARHGIAVGHHSPVFGSSVFRTSDGGKSWAGVPGAPHHHWRSGSCQATRGGLLLDEQGGTAIVSQKEVFEIKQPLDGAKANAVHFGDREPSWLVGDDGLVVVSNNGGRSWQHAIPPDLLEQTKGFNWRCVTVSGGHVWIAGSPGTTVLHSSDRGQHWELFDTGQLLPIHAMHFIDEQRGWSAGPLGTILSTRDGGRTWRVQRGGGRAAFVAFASSPDRIPYELFARACCMDGFLGVLVLLDQTGPTPRSSWRSDQTIQHRLRQAISAVGGSSAVVCRLTGQRLFGDAARRRGDRRAAPHVAA